MIINKVIQHSMVSGGEDTLTTLPLTNFCSLSEVPFENLKRSLFIELYEAIYDGESRSYRSFYNSRANSPLLGYEFNYNGVDLGVIQTTRYSAKALYAKQGAILKKNFMSQVTPPVAINILSANRISIRRCGDKAYPREKYMFFQDVYADNVVINAIYRNKNEILTLANKLISRINGVSIVKDIKMDPYNFCLNAISSEHPNGNHYLSNSNAIIRFTVYNALVLATYCYMSCSPEEREDVSLLDFPVLMLYSGNEERERLIIKEFQKLLPLSQFIYVVPEVQTTN